MKSENEQKLEQNNSCPSLEGSEDVQDESEERNQADKKALKEYLKHNFEEDKNLKVEWPADDGNGDSEDETWGKSKGEKLDDEVLGVGTKTDETLLVSRFTYIEESTVESDPSGNLDEKPCHVQSEEVKHPHGGGDAEEQNGIESEMTLIPDKVINEKIENDLYPPRAVDIRLGDVNARAVQRSDEVKSFDDSFERSPSRNNDGETYEDEGGSEDNVEDNELSEAVSNRIKWRESNAGRFFF